MYVSKMVPAADKYLDGLQHMLKLGWVGIQ
jgi:hypothetical protein